MATTTTKTPSSYSAPTYYDDVAKIQQQAYNMSSDWLAQTVQYGQDTGKMQAATKGYYDAAADDRKYTAQNQASSNTFEQQMALFDKQTQANKAAAEAQKSYTITTNAQQQMGQQALAQVNNQGQLDILKQQNTNDLAKSNNDYANQSKMLSQNQSFAASQAALDRAAKSSGSQADRELQKYLGELDAQAKMTSSFYSSIGGNQTYDYRYW